MKAVFVNKKSRKVPKLCSINCIIRAHFFLSFRYALLMWMQCRFARGDCNNNFVSYYAFL